MCTTDLQLKCNILIHIDLKHDLYLISLLCCFISIQNYNKDLIIFCFKQFLHMGKVFAL